MALSICISSVCNTENLFVESHLTTSRMSEMTELIKLVNGLQEASSISGLSHELGLPKIVVVGG